MESKDEYGTGKMVAEMCGINPNSVARFATAAKIRIRQLPGLPPKYHLGDVKAALAKSYRVAGEQTSVATESPHALSATAG